MRQTPSIFYYTTLYATAFVAAVGGVVLEDVGVATFQLFQDSGLVDYAGTQL